MNLLCLCPTYGRPPALLENTIELFLRQDYPAEKCCLLLYDDLGNVSTFQNGNQKIADPREHKIQTRWYVRSTNERESSLPAKYDSMLASEPWGDAVVVWDDDEIYMPWHLSAHAAALSDHGWSKPSLVRSLYKIEPDGKPFIESGHGRFHGSIAIRRELLAQVGGWIGVMPRDEAKRADFDQRMIGALTAIEPPGDLLLIDPLEYDPRPSFIYGWGRSQHCSGLMRSPDDQTWYDRHAETAYREPIGQLTPRLDSQSEKMLALLAGD